jgi:molybdopterin converting factor small subunit
MAIIVRFPAMLRASAGSQVDVREPVRDIAELVTALERQLPGIAEKLADPIFNFAVNDEMLLHRVFTHPLYDGDTVEIVPTISGGMR